MIQQATEHYRIADYDRLTRFSIYPTLKAVFDYAAAVVLFVVCAPVIAVGALLVKLTSPGPAFYTQTRVGRNGKHYTLYKLRSMRHDCEKTSGPRWSTVGDPRVTPFGRFLRKSHLDELPQLLNVLSGDMSLVGPRPERPEIIPQLEEALPLYRTRLLVRPGVTGIAQVQLPPDTDLESVRRKLAYDVYYVQNVSPRLDFQILLATALYLSRLSFSLVGRFVLLPSDGQIERAYLRFSQSTGIPAHMPRPAAHPREAVEMASV